MINDEEIVSSCERANKNFENFSENITSATNTLRDIIEKKGVSKELEFLYVLHNKLLLNYFEFRKEYLGLVIGALSDDEVRSVVESAEKENSEYISETIFQLNKFK